MALLPEYTLEEPSAGRLFGLSSFLLYCFSRGQLLESVKHVAAVRTLALVGRAIPVLSPFGKQILKLLEFLLILLLKLNGACLLEVLLHLYFDNFAVDEDCVFASQVVDFEQGPHARAVNDRDSEQAFASFYFMFNLLDLLLRNDRLWLFGGWFNCE